ncbi:hypothetical protein J7E29_07025 [Streptomyces sp. ISL-90]|nr:hypothetical protein [Streptomyces sp. ISL-90]
MGQTHLIDRAAHIGSAVVVVLLIEREDDQTIVHIRALSADDAREVAAARLSLVDGTGQRVEHVATHTGGTGLETHVTLVYAAAGRKLRLVTADGSEVFAELS